MTGEASGLDRDRWEEAPQALRHQIVEDLLECLTCEGLQGLVWFRVCPFLQARVCRRERRDHRPGCARAPRQMETAYNRHWSARSPHLSQREVLQ